MPAQINDLPTNPHPYNGNPREEARGLLAVGEAAARAEGKGDGGLGCGPTVASAMRMLTSSNS